MRVASKKRISMPAIAGATAIALAFSPANADTTPISTASENVSTLVQKNGFLETKTVEGSSTHLRLAQNKSKENQSIVIHVVSTSADKIKDGSTEYENSIEIAKAFKILMKRKDPNLKVDIVSSDEEKYHNTAFFFFVKGNLFANDRAKNGMFVYGKMDKGEIVSALRGVIKFNEKSPSDKVAKDGAKIN